MVEQAEKLWTYEVVEPGQIGAETVVAITSGNIAGYAQVALNDDPRYRGASATLAMPTMVLAYAPLLREEIAEANGFVAQEQSKTARRQTPFAKCEIRWHKPVCEGDTITGTRGVLEKYERRGSRFVTFRVGGVNQRGETAVEYDYTCIFDYAQGQREVPAERPNPNPLPEGEGIATRDGTGQRLLLDFDSAVEGTALAELSITESQEIINNRSAFRLAGQPSESNIHTDEEFARRNIFGGTVNSGPATMSYVDRMLQLSFQPEAFYHGGSLLMRAITPFRSGDTVAFAGEVTGRRREGDRGIVECRVRGTNQRGELVCLADATLAVG
jgi:acyl dehydratase